ncbi:MAG TPA: RraA family protein [Phycisphaerae bacterium]|nr:RraA family protein [Phycisphaerae bacterium]
MTNMITPNIPHVRMDGEKLIERRLSDSELLELRRWNTPTIFNGWEQITRHNPTTEGINLEECRDFMPQMGAMVGYAVTVTIEPGNPEHRRRNPNAWSEYREYIASVPGPKIVVVQDLDKPRTLGAFWGEVNSNIHRALGCVGTIIDGGIRDLEEMNNAGFKAIARRLCVGHGFDTPVAWGGEVEVFGRRVCPGQLIHADKHGFLVVPKEDEARLLEAARYMDHLECKHLIAAARNVAGKLIHQILQQVNEAARQMNAEAKERFGRRTEW